MNDGCFFCEFKEKIEKKGFEVQVYEKKLEISCTMCNTEYGSFTEDIEIEIKYCPMCGRKFGGIIDNYYMQQ